MDDLSKRYTKKDLEALTKVDMIPYKTAFELLLLGRLDMYNKDNISLYYDGKMYWFRTEPEGLERNYNYRCDGCE